MAGITFTRVSLELALLLLHNSHLNLRPEGADESLHGPRGRVAQGADRVAFDLIGELLEHVDLLELGVARDEAVHDVGHPRGALAARRALAARLVLVELGQTRDRGDNVRRFVEDGDGRGAEAGPPALEVVKVHQSLVAVVLGQDRHGRTAGDDAEQVVPPADDPLAVLLEQLLHGDGHLLLDGDRVVDVARDAEELGASVVLPAEASEPLGTAPKDGRRHRDGLDVRYRRGAAVQSSVGGEGRLQPRLARLALQGLDETGLLAADVRATAAVQADVEVDARPASVLANESCRVGLGNGLLENHRLVDELATNVNVRRRGAHRDAGDQAALDELVRVVPHDLPILARARLGLVGIHDEVLRRVLVVLRHEGPLETAREAGTAAAAQA
mmetsp:Transcript_29325/g.50220  ORF Transcript_29325/g.50220 Transcript_29325/m.50220 type:complete len:387 (+) Transcript_29325:480-1640(+)